MARPCKLTDEIQDKIASAIKAGNYMETAAAYAGVNKDTFYEWLKKGARSKTNNKFRRFSDAIEKALADAEVRDVLLIGKAAEKEWTAAAWRLERKFPRKWGRMERHELTGAEGGPIEVAPGIDWSKLPVEKRKQLKSLIDEARGLGQGNEGPGQIPG